MKKLTQLFGSLLGVSLLSLWLTHATSLEDAILWGYDNGLTIYTTAVDFRAHDSLRRDEAAKFLVEFAKLNGNSLNTVSSSCSFNDTDKARPDLKGYLQDACRAGILKGNGNYIMPDQKLTNAQIVTTVVRIMDGRQSEANVSHRADNYYIQAQNLWLSLTNFWSKDSATTRENVMLLLYDAYNGGSDSWSKNINDILQQLVNILDE